MNNIIINEQWPVIAEKIRQNRAIKTIFLLGACDTGKSTFAQYLVEALSTTSTTGYLDCDPGQSVLGTPATLGLGLYRQESGKAFEITAPIAKYLRFVGSNSPPGHLVENIIGIKKLLEKAYLGGAERVVIDSCGYIQDAVAKSFQYHSIDITAPDLIIELSKDQALKSLLLNFSKSSEIMKLPVSQAVIKKDPDMRKENREIKIKQYFTNAKSATLDINTLGLHGRIPDFNQVDSYQDLLIGLCNRNQFVVVLGIIKDINTASRQFTVFAPSFPADRITSIHFGSLYCSSLSGEHANKFK